MTLKAFFGTRKTSSLWQSTVIEDERGYTILLHRRRRLYGKYTLEISHYIFKSSNPFGRASIILEHDLVQVIIEFQIENLTQLDT